MAYNAQTVMCLSIFYPKIYTNQFFKEEFSPITLQKFQWNKSTDNYIDYFLFFIQLIFLLNEIQFLK